MPKSRHTIEHICIQMQEGLLKNDSPRGIWEITEAGRRWYATGYR